MTWSDVENVRSSDFYNTSGRLSLVKHRETGDLYFMMEDFRGEDFFGPLTQREVEAFNTICDFTDPSNDHSNPQGGAE